MRGHQRYRCRACGCHFTDTPLRGKPPAMKALAVLLYGMGGMSFSMIGRVLGVSDVAVLKWVRPKASTLPEPEIGSSVVTVEVDEMWHYLRKSLPSCGFAPCGRAWRPDQPPSCRAAHQDRWSKYGCRCYVAGHGSLPRRCAREAAARRSRPCAASSSCWPRPRSACHPLRSAHRTIAF